MFFKPRSVESEKIVWRVKDNRQQRNLRQEIKKTGLFFNVQKVHN